MISHEAWNQIESFCSGTLLEHAVILEKINSTIESKQLKLPEKLDTSLEIPLLAYVPEVALPKLKIGQMSWMVNHFISFCYLKYT